ncbi:MAG: acyl-CoA thioesterase [Gottschalkiaceae bacterium]|nr:MAG: acyl-CoA thioesterase [Gottschalkiaceae bacterium]
MNRIKVSRLVKSEDLNHHGTLFAGRMAEWFVETCFICGAKVTGRPENIVCINIHGLTFTEPGDKGDIINLESYVVRIGKTSFTVYGTISKNNSDKIISDGFITFVFVDEDNNPIPHNIVLDDAKDDREREARERALKLR